MSFREEWKMKDREVEMPKKGTWSKMKRLLSDIFNDCKNVCFDQYLSFWRIMYMQQNAGRCRSLNSDTTYKIQVCNEKKIGIG